MPNDPAADVAVLIPSYEPDQKLPPYVDALLEAGFGKVVVVDDGSGEAYDDIFESLSHDGDEGVQVIRYLPNHGKGYALRQGLAYLQAECPQCHYVLTADSDGQHTVQDALRMAEALRVQEEDALLLGSRDFNQPHVPWKSRKGNHITSTVFRLLYGQHVPDTQTGLRGFPRALLERFLQTSGDRYEYEMNQLIDCATDRIPMRFLSIETVYENNNEGSHFNPVRDSWRIYRVILSRFFRFIAASLLSFLVDYAIYLLLNNLLRAYAPGLDVTIGLAPFRFIARIGLAAGLARIVSSTFNFLVNRKYVFASRMRIGASFWRYAVTVVVILCLSAWLTSSLHVWFGWSDNFIKMPVDIVLFFLSYYIQRRWVFGGHNQLPAQP